MTTHSSVDFFDQQFGRQIAGREFALNPFESAALPYLRGHVLDFGCGLGNLAVYAARKGHPVAALDASPTAIEFLRAVAQHEGLPLQADRADLRTTRLGGVFQTVVSIGLLMFFDCATADRQLSHLQSLVAPGGLAVVNVLTQGTSFMDMFSEQGHCLFETGSLKRRFAGWRILVDDRATYPAPGGTVKVFETVIAEKRP